MPSPIGASQIAQSSRPAALVETSTAAAQQPDAAFGKLLMNSLRETSDLQQNAQTAAEAHLAGGDVTQVEAFAAMKKADIALKMLLQIRNKTLAAYNEIKDLRM